MRDNSGLSIRRAKLGAFERSNSDDYLEHAAFGNTHLLLWSHLLVNGEVR